MFEFKLPDLGEGIHEGELLKWHVAVGDQIKEDDPLCEVETDKAAVTIPSPRTGTISSLNANPGDTIYVGHVFVTIDDNSGAGSETHLPGEPSGAQVSDTKPSGPESTGPNQSEPPPPAPVSESPSEPAAGPRTRIIAAPATRRLAREMGIDIQMVTGSGPGGRVTPDDLNQYADSGSQQTRLPDQPDSGMEPVPSVSDSPIPFLSTQSYTGADDGPMERIPIRSLRKKVAVKMTSSSIMIPHVAHMDEIDVTELEGLRQEFNSKHGKGAKLTLMAFVIKAAAALLKEYPGFNASVDHEAQEILHKKFYNIGFAADTPRGLMVPVIHDADRQSLAGIGYRIQNLAAKARQGEITVEELTRGTFTITNVGAIGGTHVFPIINAPETAILGLGRVEKKPVVLDDEIRIRSILPVTLCFDHRVADGAQAAAFVRDMKSMLESSLEFMAGV